MNIDESKILLSIDLQGGFDKQVEGMSSQCTKKITLGPDFIARALKDSAPAYSLKVFKPGTRPREYKRLSDNMKLHLHVKQFVADDLGIDFGGRLNCFKWELV